MPEMNELNEKHPADWSGATLPRANGWQFVIDDIGCPVWKTDSPPTIIDENVTNALIRIEDPQSMTDSRNDEEVPSEYYVHFIGHGRPTSTDIDLDKNTLTESEVQKVLDEMGKGNNPLQNDGTRYDIRVATKADPRQLLSIVEQILNGQYLITENTDTATVFKEGKWALHTL